MAVAVSTTAEADSASRLGTPDVTSATRPAIVWGIGYEPATATQTATG
jgi:type IV secretory pathway VirB3-like protein